MKQRANGIVKTKMELTAEMVSIAFISTIGLVGWFCRNVLAELKEIRADLHQMASGHGERIVRLETKADFS